MFSLISSLIRGDQTSPSTDNVVPAQEEAEQFNKRIKVEQDVNKCASLAYSQLAHLPEEFRKLAVHRLIGMHNADAKFEPSKLLLREQDFQANYPKLNLWIENKLNFFKSKRSIANVAFACGHFADFLDARDNFPANIHKIKCEFFRNYFQNKGTSNGIKDLSRIISILNEFEVGDVPDLDQLEEAKFGMNVEEVNGSPSSNDQFNYPAALAIVESIPTSDAESLVNHIGLGYTAFKNIMSENNSDQALSFLVMFHIATTQKNLTNDKLVRAFYDSELGLLGNELKGYQKAKVALGNQ